jgi:hypothetical protein
VTDSIGCRSGPSSYVPADRQLSGTAFGTFGQSGSPSHRIWQPESNGMDAPTLNRHRCAKVDVSSNHLNEWERPR